MQSFRGITLCDRCLCSPYRQFTHRILLSFKQYNDSVLLCCKHLWVCIFPSRIEYIYKQEHNLFLLFVSYFYNIPNSLLNFYPLDLHCDICDLFMEIVEEAGDLVFLGVIFLVGVLLLFVIFFLVGVTDFFMLLFFIIFIQIW